MNLNTTANMEVDMHLYEVVGSQGEQKHASYCNEMERITSFNNEQEYMSLCGPQQEESSDYQQPQRCGRTDTKTAANNDEVKEAADCHVLKDELKRTKICLRALSFLIVILFLITVISLGLAAYCLSSTRSGNDLEHRLNTINSEVMSQRTYINNLESQFNSSQGTFTNSLETQFNTINAEAVSQRTFINDLESQFNTINSEVTSQGTFINTLNSQLNRINSDISTVRSSVTSLQNQLTHILTNSSPQITVTNQPSK